MTLGELFTKLRRLGWRNGLGLIGYHLLPLRYSTPCKAWNVVRVKIQRWLRTEHVWGMPYRYYLDPINICNLHCPLCPTGLGILGRPRGYFDLTAFRRIVDEIAPYAYTVELYNWGEPFLHPDIVEMIRYAHSRRIAVRLSSNMNRFSPELAQAVVEAGLDRLIVSLDGSTQETYVRYRRGGDLARVCENVRLLVEAKRRAHSKTPFILVRMLVMRHNEQEIEAVRALANDLGADAFSVAPIFVDTTDANQVAEWLPIERALSAYESTSAPTNRWACAELWEAMTINWDGGLSPCCWVHQKSTDLGNAFEQPLREAWNSPAYVSARRAFARGGPKPPLIETVCNRCQGHPLYLKE